VFYVGQDGILRPIGNRPVNNSVSNQADYQSRRRLPTCPTRRSRYFFAMAAFVPTSVLRMDSLGNFSINPRIAQPTSAGTSRDSEMARHSA